MGCKNEEMARLLAGYEMGVLPEEERRRFERHLLECPDCAEDLYESAPVAEVFRERAGLEEGPDQVATAPARPQRWRLRRVVVLMGGVAAVVILALALRLLLPEQPAEIRRGEPTGSVLLYGPKDEVQAVETFRWAPVSGASEYRVTVLDEAGESVWEAVVAVPPALLPEEDRQALKAGESYFWRVEALSDDGRLWESRTVRFRLAD